MTGHTAASEGKETERQFPILHSAMLLGVIIVIVEMMPKCNL